MHCNEVKDKLMGYIEKDLSANEMDEIENHLNECPDCEKIYLILSKMDKVLSYVGKNYSLNPLENLYPDTVRKIIDKSKTSTKEKRRISRKRFVFSFVSIIAVFIIICIGFLYLIQSYNKEIASIVKRDGNVIIVKKKNKIDIVQFGKGILKRNDEIMSNQDGFVALKLKDNPNPESASTIFVDKNSHITLRSPRRIRLITGTIFCEVAKADKQFIVTTPYSDVIVKGTKFEVNASKDGIRTSVADGKVTVKSRKLQRDITKGFSVTVYENGELSDAKQVAIENIGLWRNKDLTIKVAETNSQETSPQSSASQITSISTSQPTPSTTSSQAGSIKTYTIEEMEKLLPDTTILYFSTNNITQLIQDIKSSKMGDIILLPFAKSWIDSKISNFNLAFKTKYEPSQGEIQTFEDLFECFNGEIIFSINTSVKNFENMNILILANLDNNTTKFKSFLKDSYFPKISGDPDVKVIDEGNTYILQSYEYFLGRKTLAIRGVVDSLFVYCTDSKLLDSIRNIDSLQSHSFTLLDNIKKLRTSQTNLLGGFTFIPIKNSILSGIKNETERQWASDFFNTLGINNFQDIIVNMEVSGEITAIAHFDGKRSRVFDWLTAPSTFNTLNFAPVNAIAFIGIHTINPSYILDDIKEIYILMRNKQDKDQSQAFFNQMMREFYQQIGNLNLEKDVLPYLGNEASIVIGNDLFPVPKILFIAEVYDTQTLHNTIINWLNINKVSYGKTDYAGQEIYFFATSELGVISEIAFSFIDKYWIVGLGREAVKSSIDAYKSGNILSTNQKFNSVIGGGNFSASAISYIDVETLASIWISHLVLELRNVPKAPYTNELQSVFKNFSPSLLKINAYDDNIEIKTSSLFDSMGPAFIFMLIPNFLEAETRSKISSTGADERALATALEAYYIDNNKYPNTLHRLTSPIAYIMSVPLDLYANQTSGEAKYIKYIPSEERNDWLIYSYGPDETDNKGQTLYDPTNGTDSKGDIVRIHQ